MTERNIFEYQGSDAQGRDDGALTIAVSDAHVRIAVAQEKVVGSDDLLFECVANLPFEEARELVRLLSTALAADS